jgi:hypothetical protein
MNKPENSLDVEDKIVDIVTDLLRNDVSKAESINQLLVLFNAKQTGEHLRSSCDWCNPPQRK